MNVSPCRTTDSIVQIPGPEPQQLTPACRLSPGVWEGLIKTAGHLWPVDEEAAVPKSSASLLPPQ